MGARSAVASCGLVLWKQPQTLIVAASLAILAMFDGGSSPLAFSLLSVLAWACVIGGLVWRALPVAGLSPQSLLAASAFVLIAVLAAVSSLWAWDQGRAMEEAVRWSAYAGVFALALLSGASGSGRATWLNGIALGLGAVVAAALLSRIWITPFPLPDTEVILLGSTYRWSYPVGYWNALGLIGVTATMVFCALGLGATGFGRVGRAASVAMAALSVGVVSMTGSRGAILAFLVGAAALVAFSPERRRQVAAIGTALLGGAILYLVGELLGLVSAGPFGYPLERALLGASVVVIFTSCLLGWLALDPLVPTEPLSGRSARLVAAASTVFALGVVVALNPVGRLEALTQPPVGGEIEGTVEGGLESGNGRWQLWGSALEAFVANPLAGLGAGGFEEWWAAQATTDLFARNAHSLPIGVLSELGVLGAALLLLAGAALVLAIVEATRRGSHPQLAAITSMSLVAVVGCLFDWSWTVPAAFAPGIAAAGLLTGYGMTDANRRQAFRIGLVALPVAWLGFALGLLEAAGEIRLSQSRSAAAAGEWDLADRRASDAAILQPWSGEPDLQRALVAEASGRPTKALSLLYEAVGHDSQDWRIALIESRMLEQLGRRGEAEAARSRSLLLYPRRAYLEAKGIVVTE